MEDGYFEGIIIGIIFCVLLVIVCVIASKIFGKKVKKIISRISDSNMQLINNTNYEIYEPNQNFLVGVSYIYDVVYEEQRIKLCLLYRRPSDRKNAIGYDIDTIYMSKKEFEEKALQTGMCVKTLHNRAMEVGYKVKGILD